MRNRSNSQKKRKKRTCMGFRRKEHVWAFEEKNMYGLSKKNTRIFP
jgi:hypothetical protein